MHLLNKYVLLPAALGLAAVPQIAAAQEAPLYAPLMMAFDGKDALSFAPASSIDIDGAGTVEMWVKATWQQDPGYDPAILSYQGAKGPRLAAVLTGDAQALGVFAGRFYATIPFNFADGALHHVALILLADQTIVMIDGEVRDTLGFGMANLPADELSIGSLGGFSPFIGEIGQIRIWDEPLDPETLVDFAWAPLASGGPGAHPDITALVGASTFGNPETGGFLFFAPAGDVDITAEPDPDIDDSELGLDDPIFASPGQ
jgi:hypothetical protein